MQVIIPREITPSILTSNVPFPDTGEVEWTAGTYNAGDERYVGETMYKSLVDSNTDEPTAGELAIPATWLDIGGVNRYRMFDQENVTVTENDDEIIVEFDYRALKDSLVLFNVDADEVNVTCTSARGGGTIYNVTQSAVNRSLVTNWWTFFKTRRGRKSTFYFSQLPGFTDAVVTVTITKTGGVAKCGNLVLGYAVDLGKVIDTQLSTRIEDTSSYLDDAFGRRTYISKSSVRSLEASVKYFTTSHEAIYRYMEDLVATPTAWIGVDRHPTSIIWGRGSFDPSLSNFEYSSATYSIEGVR